MLEKLKKKYLNIPYALPWGEWDEWDKKAKKEHPIAFLLLITIPGYFGRMKNKLRNAVWWVKHRIIPRHRYHLIDTKLPPEYYDIDVRMLYGCFSLLVDYVENELPHASSVDKKNKSKRQIGLEALDSYIVFNLEEDQKNHADMYQEIKDLYLWWNDVYLKRNDEQYVPELYEQNYQEDNEKLIQLVKLRGFMWT